MFYPRPQAVVLLSSDSPHVSENVLCPRINGKNDEDLGFCLCRVKEAQNLISLFGIPRRILLLLLMFLNIVKIMGGKIKNLKPEPDEKWPAVPVGLAPSFLVGCGFTAREIAAYRAYSCAHLTSSRTQVFSLERVRRSGYEITKLEITIIAQNSRLFICGDRHFHWKSGIQI